MSWIRDRVANRLVRLMSNSRAGSGSSGGSASGDLNEAVASGNVILIDGSASDMDEEESDEYVTTDEGSDEEQAMSTGQPGSEGAGSKVQQNLLTTSQAAALLTPNVFPAAVTQRELGFRPLHAFPASHLLPGKREQLETIRAKVFCGSYDQTGNVFLSASQDCQVRVYDTSGGRFQLMRSIFAQDVGWSILDTAISPSGQQFLYTSWSPVIRLCNVFGPASQHEILNLESVNRNMGLFSVRYSPNGVEVIAGASDHCVYVYDLQSRSQVLRLKAQENDVNAVAFADSSSNILVSGGDEGLLKVWDRRQLVDRRPKPVGLFAGHFDGITFIDPRDDGRHLISNSKDQTIKLWDMRCFARRGAVEEARERSLSGFWDYRWAPVPRRVVNNKLRMDSDTSIMTYRSHTVRQTLIRCHFSPLASTGQRYIYTGCATGRVWIYDALTGEVVRSLPSHNQNCRDVSWHPFFPELISSSWDGSIVKWVYADDEVLALTSESGRRSRLKQRPSLSRMSARQMQEFDDI